MYICFVTDLKKKDNLCIYQSKMNPPHFKVVLEDDVWNLSRVSGINSHSAGIDFSLIPAL